MKGANVIMLLQAIDEMEKHYTGSHLGRQLAIFKTILHRSTMVSEQDKEIVEMRMKVFDELLDQDPWFQGLVRARVEERVEQEKMRAELQGAQKTVLTIIKARFPSLTDEVRQQVEGITRLEALEQLAGQIATAPDEATVRQALSTFAA